MRQLRSCVSVMQIGWHKRALFHLALASIPVLALFLRCASRFPRHASRELAMRLRRIFLFLTQLLLLVLLIRDLVTATVVFPL